MLPSPRLLTLSNQQCLNGILDPSLALSPYGLPIAKHLGNVLELWIVRELWHILDNIQFYQQHPESLLVKTTVATTPVIQSINPQEIIQTLEDWKFLRVTTVPTKLNLFWIGDNKSESFLPSDADSQLIWYWELLAHSLDNRLDKHSLTSTTLTSAFRDTIALAAALKSSFILTYQLPEKPDTNLPPPDICIALESWGIPCQQIAFNDPIATIEREHLLHLIVRAGLSKFLWAGLNLAVLHLVLPSASHLHHGEETQETQDFGIEDHTEKFTLTPNLWQGARGFWYQLKN